MEEPDDKLETLVEITRGYVLPILFFVFCIRLYTTLWLTEDSFISLRVAINIIEGQGFVYNIGERVLAVTNPLWTMPMAVFVWMFGHPLHTILYMGVVCSLLGVGVLIFRAAPKPEQSIPALIALCGSRYFIDYSTGGLENPLVHLLLFIFFTLYLYIKPKYFLETYLRIYHLPYILKRYLLVIL